MLEEALPVAAGVAIALLPAMAFGGLSAARAFIYLGGAESGFFDAIEAGKRCARRCLVAAVEKPLFSSSKKDSRTNHP